MVRIRLGLHRRLGRHGRPKGHTYAFDDPAVQHSPNLFRAADLSPDEASRAEADYLTATLDTNALADAMDGRTAAGHKVHVPQVNRLRRSGRRAPAATCATKVATHPRVVLVCERIEFGPWTIVT